MCIPCDKTFFWYQQFEPFDLDLWVWHIFEKLQPSPYPRLPYRDISVSQTHHVFIIIWWCLHMREKFQWDVFTTNKHITKENIKHEYIGHAYLCMKKKQLFKHCNHIVTLSKHSFELFWFPYHITSVVTCRLSVCLKTFYIFNFSRTTGPILPNSYRNMYICMSDCPSVSINLTLVITVISTEWEETRHSY